MKTHNLDSWEAFEEVVKQNDIKTRELKQSEQTILSTTPVLFRGQKNAEWELESTLERKAEKDITVDSYFNLMLKAWNRSTIKNKQKWPDLEKQIKELNVDSICLFPTEKANSGQIIYFMAHLRHYGFPSPLLDWTANSRIAAFFAFENIPDTAERIAIYTFRKQTGDMSENLRRSSESTTIEIGPNIPGIERHVKQEASYTLCVQQDDGTNFRNARFANMKEDINRSGVSTDSNGNDVDLGLVKNVTNKYTIPVSERNKVLKKLQTMNINRCFLFEETEDNRLSDCWNSILANEQI